MQQSDNEFCTNLTANNLNSINNNKINNGSHDDDVNMMKQVDDEDFILNNQQQQQQNYQQPQQVPTIDNDDNNNRDHANNFGPETDVDAIIDDEEFHFNATGGEKERNQMEFKEIADVTDHAEMQQQHQSDANPSNAMFGALENKIFGEIFPEMKGGNPFAMSTANEAIDNFANVVMPPLDNKMIEEQIDEMQLQQHELQQQFEYGANEFVEKMENAEREIDFLAHETAANTAGFMEELISSANNNEEVAIHQEEPQSGELNSL